MEGLFVKSTGEVCFGRLIGFLQDVVDNLAQLLDLVDFAMHYIYTWLLLRA